MATSTTAVTNRRRRRREAGCITVSSKPTIFAGPTRPGSAGVRLPMRSTADHTVDHDTPKPRAIDAGCPLDGRDPVGGPLRRPGRQHPPGIGQLGLLGPRVHLAVGVRAAPDPLAPPHPHRRRPAGASRSVTHRRSFGTALVPHAEQPTSRCVVSTSTTSSMPSSTTFEHLEPGRAEPQRTTFDHQGLLYLGPSDSHEIHGGPYLNGGPSPPSHPSFVA